MPTKILVPYNSRNAKISMSTMNMTEKKSWVGHHLAETVTPIWMKQSHPFLLSLRKLFQEETPNSVGSGKIRYDNIDGDVDLVGDIADDDDDHADDDDDDDDADDHADDDDDDGDDDADDHAADDDDDDPAEKDTVEKEDDMEVNSSDSTEFNKSNQ